MNIYTGTIITCDEKDTVFRYLVEDKGIIRFAGDKLPDEYKSFPRKDLGTKALIPSFVDSHLHFSSFGFFHAGLDVSTARSNTQIFEMIRSERDRGKKKIIIGFGLSANCVKEGSMITREELDTILPDQQAVMVKYDGHACVLNSALLKKLPKKIAFMRGCNPGSGEFRQEAFFAAIDYISSRMSPLTLMKNMLEAYDYMAEKGFGMFHTVSGVGFPRDLDVDLERWMARGISQDIQTRLYFQTMDTDLVRKRKLPRIGGCFKTALDGCFGSMDAALHLPYENSDDQGVLYYSDEVVTDFCKKANQVNLQIELHAIGDAAFDQAVRGISAALKDCPREDHRHGIIHACLPTEQGMDQCAELGIHMPVQPAFLNWPQEPSSWLRSILGDREERLNPLQSLWSRGILLSGGSDAPCTAPDPVHGIHCACNHPVSGESLTIQDALKLFTINGYKTSFDEQTRGSLEQGKIADMVILSENPLSMDVTRLKELEVKKTILKGKVWEKKKQGVIPTLIRGMISNRSV